MDGGGRATQEPKPRATQEQLPRYEAQRFQLINHLSLGFMLQPNLHSGFYDTLIRRFRTNTRQTLTL